MVLCSLDTDGEYDTMDCERPCDPDQQEEKTDARFPERARFEKPSEFELVQAALLLYYKENQ